MRSKMEEQSKLHLIKSKLKDFPIFKKLDNIRIDELCQKSDIIEVEAGSVIFKKDESCQKGVFLVVDGVVSIDNSEKSVSYKVSNGDFVGLTAFLGRRTYPVTATCVEDSELIFLPDI